MLLTKLPKTPLKIQPTHYKQPHHTKKPVQLSALQVHAQSKISNELKILSSFNICPLEKHVHRRLYRTQRQKKYKSLEFLFWSLLW